MSDDGETELLADWRVNGKIAFCGKFENETYETKGEILQFVPEQILEYTYWNPLTGLPDLPGNYAHFRFELQALDTGTELRFTHEHIVGEAVYEHSLFYWTSTLPMLKHLIEQAARK